MTAEPGSQKTIFVTVLGGVAYVCEDTVPSDVRIEIIDFDDLNESPQEVDKLSEAAKAYVRKCFYPAEGQQW